MKRLISGLVLVFACVGFLVYSILLDISFEPWWLAPVLAVAWWVIALVAGVLIRFGKNAIGDKG